MDRLPSSSTADLVNELRLVVARVKRSTSSIEKNRGLEQILELLRKLRDCAPELSLHLSKELQEQIVNIEPILSTAGMVAGGIGAAVAVLGLFMQGLCEDESDRRVGSRMARYGGAVALGSFEIVSMIEEVVAELKPALQSSPELPSLQSSAALKHRDSSEEWRTETPRSAHHRKSPSRQGGW